MYGQGNISYNDAPAFDVLTATDGLSTDAATGKVSQLGQTIGRAGDPAALTEDREIPDGVAHRLIYIGKNNGVDDALALGTQVGYNVSNKTGQFFQGIGVIAGNNSRVTLRTDDGKNGVIEFAPTSGIIADIVYNDDAANPSRFDVTQPWITDAGYGSGYNLLESAVHPNYALLNTDVVVLCNTAGGNQIINIDVVTKQMAKQHFVFKKISLDANTITLNMVAGTFQEMGAPAANYVFNLPGQTVRIFVDELNAYKI